MALFRPVSLPGNASGQLFLHSMPGRAEGIEQCWIDVKCLPVHIIVCLASDDEIAKQSPKYMSAIQTAAVPCERWPFPVPDYGIPENGEELLHLAAQVAESLMQGRNVLVHCGAGIGRTGMFAALVLMRLRLPLEQALKTVRAAGSSPETDAQHAFLETMRCNTVGSTD